MSKREEIVNLLEANLDQIKKAIEEKTNLITREMATILFWNLEERGYLVREVTKQQEPECWRCDSTIPLPHNCLDVNKEPTNPTAEVCHICGQIGPHPESTCGRSSEPPFNYIPTAWGENLKEPTTKETMEPDRLSVIEAKLEYLLECALNQIPSRIETLEMMAEWKKLK